MKRPLVRGAGCCVHLELAAVRAPVVVVQGFAALGAFSRPDLKARLSNLVGGGRKPVEVHKRDMTVVPFYTRVQFVRNRAAARIADNVNSIGTGAFDLLDRRIEMPEAVDCVGITGPSAVRVGECVILYVRTADVFGTGQPLFHLDFGSFPSAEESNINAHRCTPSQK